MDMWVIYNHPKDYPNNFVVRLWKIENAQVTHVVISPSIDNVKLTTTLKEARAAVPKGKTKIPRYDDDDPVIVEVWI